MTDERRGTSPAPHGGDDPLDRELRRLLAVDPSPAFEARVRARVAAEPAANGWRAGRLRLTFGAAAAALVVAVALLGPEPPADVGDGSGPGTERAGGIAPTSSGAATRTVSLPGVPVGPNAPERTGGATPTTSGAAPRAVSLPGVPVGPNAPEPAVPRAPRTEFRAAAGPPRVTAAPPSAPMFTRVVFSANERDALRRLLAQAGNRPVVLPVPATTRPDATGEAPPRFDASPIALEPPAGLEIPPIAIEPLSLALLETGAIE